MYYYVYIAVLSAGIFSVLDIPLFSGRRGKGGHAAEKGYAGSARRHLSRKYARNRPEVGINVASIARAHTHTRARDYY